MSGLPCTGRIAGDTHSPPSIRGTSRTQPTHPNHLLANCAGHYLRAVQVNHLQPGSDYHRIDAQLQLESPHAHAPHCADTPLLSRRWLPAVKAVYAAGLAQSTALQQSLAAAQARDATSSANLFQTAINSAAAAAGMVQCYPRPGEPQPCPAHQPFFDAECRRSSSSNQPQPAIDSSWSESVTPWSAKNQPK